MGNAIIKLITFELLKNAQKNRKYWEVFEYANWECNKCVER
jgi:hypothetical protein